MRRRWRRLASAGALALSVAQGASAQDPTANPVLTIDQDRLFVESAFGRTVIARESAAAQALEAENARIEAELIAEEQALTDRRATLPAAEFAALADAFDAKVVRIRTEQDTKARELARARDTSRQEFFRAAVPVLGDLLVERGASVILDTSATTLSLSSVDVTDAAIAKVDAQINVEPSAFPPAPSEELPAGPQAPNP